ncbi:MAG TPA: hypothetical protein VN192_06160 [Flavobacterium sp.]|nr:hypothetical protein [Flavobacterium sp.]
MKNLLILLLFTTYTIQSQVNDSIAKPKYIEIKINETYERMIQKGCDSIEMYEYLGNYYYGIKNFGKSKYYYSLLFQKYDQKNFIPKTIEQYNIILKSI